MRRYAVLRRLLSPWNLRANASLACPPLPLRRRRVLGRWNLELLLNSAPRAQKNFLALSDIKRHFEPLPGLKTANLRTPPRRQSQIKSTEPAIVETFRCPPTIRLPERVKTPEVNTGMYTVVCVFRLNPLPPNALCLISTQTDALYSFGLGGPNASQCLRQRLTTDQIRFNCQRTRLSATASAAADQPSRQPFTINCTNARNIYTILL
jgi:hypothetical protein